MPSEKSIQKSLLKALNSMSCTKAIKLHGSGFQEAGTPDVFCVSYSNVFLFELKKPGGVVSDIQQVRLDEWSMAGAKCLVCYSAGDAIYYVLASLTKLELGEVLAQKQKSVTSAVVKEIANFFRWK